MKSIKEYAQQQKPQISIREYAKIPGDIDLGKIQNKEKVERVKLELTGQETERELRFKQADFSARRLEAQGKFKEALELRNAVSEEKGISQGFFAPWWQGVGDVATGVGQGMAYAGEKFDIDRFKNTGDKLKKFGTETSEIYRNEETERILGEYDYTDLFKPEFYHHNILRAAPFTLALLPASIATAYGGATVLGGVGTAIAGRLALGIFGKTVLKHVGQIAGGLAANTLFSRPIESAIEAGQVYSEMLEKTDGNKELAIKAGDRTFKNNMKLSGMDTLEALAVLTPAKKIPFLKTSSKLGKGIAGKGALIGGKMAVTGGMEATEEILQQKFSTEAKGEKFSLSDPSTKQAGVVGFLMGGLTAGGGEAFTTFQEKVRARMPEKMKAEYETNLNKNLEAGDTQQTAEIRAMDKTAESNKGATEVIVAKEIKEMAGETGKVVEPSIEEKEVSDVKEIVEKIPEKKIIKYSKNTFNTMESIDKFLEKNNENLTHEQIESLFELQNKIYERGNKIAEKEQVRMFNAEDRAKHEIFYKGEENENQYQSFKKLVKSINSNKLAASEDVAGLRNLLTTEKSFLLNNALYSQEITGDEMLDIFKERLTNERTEKVSEENRKRIADIEERSAEIKSTIEEVKKGFDVDVKEKPVTTEKEQVTKTKDSYKDRAKAVKAPVKPTPVAKKPVLDTLNPTGGLYIDYTPQKRMAMKLGENMTTLDKTSNKSSEEIITIYRGASKNQKDIVPGDFITTNHNLAKDYAGEGNILQKRVKMSDVLDDITEPLGEEYIYRPKLLKETSLAKTTKTTKTVKTAKATKTTKTTKTTKAIKIEKELDYTGKKKTSKLFKRLKKDMPEFIAGLQKDDPTYTATVARDDIARAATFVEEHYEQAVSIVLGEIAPPSGIRLPSLLFAIAKMAREKGDLRVQKEAIKKLLIVGTKAGKEVEAFKHLPKDSPEFFVKEAIKARIEKVGRARMTIEKGKEKMSKQVDERIKSNKQKLKKEIDKRVPDITNAQKIINSLLC